MKLILNSIILSILLLFQIPAYAEQKVPSNEVAQLTNKIIASIAEYRRTNIISENFNNLVIRRKELLLNSLENNPEFVLSNLLPNGLVKSLPSNLNESLEQEIKVTGRIYNLHGDDFVNKTFTNKYFIESNKTLLRIHANNVSYTIAPFVGKTITIKGTKLDNQLLVNNYELAQLNILAEQLESALVTGDQKTIVLLAEFLDRPSECTNETANNTVFGEFKSVNGLYKETTYNEVSFSGNTYGPFSIPYNSTLCEFTTWSMELDNIITQQGINLSSYARKVYVFPPNVCPAAGYGMLGGPVTSSWIFHCNIQDIFAHELGHNLGFGHANIPATETYNGEYGDTSDIMGYSNVGLRQFNAPNKVRAEWIDLAHVYTITDSGTFTISPTELYNPINPQALTLVKPDTAGTYYISLRKPIGYDSILGVKYRDKVSIHYTSAPLSRPTILVAALGIGQNYVDSINGYEFVVNDINAETANVTVNLSAPVCQRSAPTVNISPTSQSAYPGTLVNYILSIKNNNNSTCGISTFAFIPSLPSGWFSSNSPTTVSLNSGESTTNTWSVTSSASATTDQLYFISLNIYDTSDSLSKALVQASYTVVKFVDNENPNVIITYPNDGDTNLSGTITVTANASDNIGVAKVEFAINGILTAIDTSYPYSFDWNTRRLKGSYTITATATDTYGNTSVPHTINVTLGKGSGKGRNK